MMQICVVITLAWAIGSRVTHAAESFSFVVMGDSRCDLEEGNCNAPGAAGVNSNVLKKVLDAVNEHDPAPKFIVFAGDMVLGKDLVGISVEQQLVNWKTIMNGKGFPLTKIMPAWGSHERSPGLGPQDSVWKA